jgi:S1-C subfamily serine protease
MWTRGRVLARGVAVAWIGVWLRAAGPAAAQETPPDRQREFDQGAQVVLTPEAVDAILFRGGSERALGATRGLGGADVFAKVAPAVVVVRTATAHGTGFLVHPEGWIVTNHHVVETGLAHDPVRGGSWATVHLGRLGADGTMSLQPEGRRAYVHKIDRALDLALLKIDPERRALPYLALSPPPPRPGASCAILGHPSSGMLWTYRSGEIAAIGRAPADLVNVVLSRLSGKGVTREQVEAALGALPARRIVLSSCEANPGDSGGPLVDGAGAVLGVTFAVPDDPAEAKFTYHVHLDELRAFLARKPAAPVLVLPDPWRAGPRALLKDGDGDGRADALFLGTTGPEQALLDVDNDSPPAALRAGAVDWPRLVSAREWDFEMAARLEGPELAVFYDTDNDGSLDLILTGTESGRAATQFTRDGRGRWTVQAVTDLPLVSSRFFKDAALGRRAEALARKLLQ